MLHPPICLWLVHPEANPFLLFRPTQRQTRVVPFLTAFREGDRRGLLFKHNQALASATMLIFSICTLFVILHTFKGFSWPFVWVHDRESLSSLYLRIYESYFLSYCTFLSVPDFPFCVTYDECYMAFRCSHATVMDAFIFLFVLSFLQELNK